jgi:hypothetical protein
MQKVSFYNFLKKSKKSIKIDPDILLKNRIVLLLVFILALANLFFYAISKDILSIVLFCLIGFVTFFFSKNMIVVLFISIVFTAILKLIYSNELFNTKSKEGFEDETKEDAKKPAKKPVKKEEMKEDFENEDDIDEKPEVMEEEEEPVEDINKEIEKLKLQNSILEKVKGFEPFLNYMSSGSK